MNFKAYCDGSCAHMVEDENWMGMGIHLLNLDDPKDSKDYAITGPKGDHNIAEYLAVISTLEIILKKEDVESLEIFSDSQLIVRQITGKYQIKKDTLKHCMHVIDGLCNRVHQKFGIEPAFGWVPRTQPRQKIADYLSNVANPHYHDIRRSIRPDSLDRILSPARYEYLHTGLKWGPIPDLPEATDIP